jgi:hypothetical protein
MHVLGDGGLSEVGMITERRRHRLMVWVRNGGAEETPTEMERYGHGGYLIKVVVMALAGEVTRELSPILSWSNNNYEN